MQTWAREASLNPDAEVVVCIYAEGFDPTDDFKDAGVKVLVSGNNQISGSLMAGYAHWTANVNDADIYIFAGPELLFSAGLIAADRDQLVDKPKTYVQFHMLLDSC